jgi:5-methylcytosine-specific restriction endonuclease McrA
MTPADTLTDEAKAAARREGARERSRRWREAHPEARREKDRRYREANREALLEKDRERSRLSRQANPEANRDRVRRWREANPEVAQAMNRRWREANPERLRETNRESVRRWREAHPEAARKASRESARRWLSANPEAARETNQAAGKRWREANPEIVRLKAARRRAHKAGVPHEPWSLAEVLQRDSWTCQLDECRCPEGRAIDPDAEPRTQWSASADHVVPISRGGPDTTANLQAAHMACNSAKGDRLADTLEEPGAG